MQKSALTPEPATTPASSGPEPAMRLMFTSRSVDSTRPCALRSERDTPEERKESARETASTMKGIRSGACEKSAPIATGMAISLTLLNRHILEKRETRSAAPKSPPMPR